MARVLVSILLGRILIITVIWAEVKMHAPFCKTLIGKGETRQFYGWNLLLLKKLAIWDKFVGRWGINEWWDDNGCIFLFWVDVPQESWLFHSLEFWWHVTPQVGKWTTLHSHCGYKSSLNYLACYWIRTIAFCLCLLLLGGIGASNSSFWPFSAIATWQGTPHCPLLLPTLQKLLFDIRMF